MGKVYRTANGKMVDMTTLLLQNELTPAIGNVKVNARGDEIDSRGEITRSRADIMQDYNKLHTMVPQDEPPKQGSALEVDTLGDEGTEV